MSSVNFGQQQILPGAVSKLGRIGLITAGCVYSMTSTAAEYEAEIATPSSMAAASGFGVSTDYFLQVFFALLLVIAVIFILSVFARRFSMFAGTNAGPIKVLSGVSLGGKDRLLLIQVGQEQLLVGTSPGNIKKVHKLATPVDPDSINGARTTEKSNFASILGSVSRG